MTCKIFVGNLDPSSRTHELRSLFEKYGRVAECDIVKNFGFVHMDDVEDAKEAIAALSGYNFNGYRMKVEMSHGRGPRRGGFRGGSSYGGGDRRDGGFGGDSYDRDGGRSSYRSNNRYEPYGSSSSGRYSGGGDSYKSSYNSRGGSDYGSRDSYSGRDSYSRSDSRRPSQVLKVLAGRVSPTYGSRNSP